MELQGKTALVMGLGVHGGGLGVARFLAERGATVTVTDLAPPEALKESLAALAGLPIRFVLGEHREEDFRSHALVVQNPGVPRDSRYLAIARAAGAAIESEMTLFFRHCPNKANIVGITGTKGKTTTALLTGAIFAEQHPDTVVAGNMRVSALEQLGRIGRDTPIVLELSSWQLEGLGQARLSPRLACVTNLSPDHLNRYASMDEYAQAKKQILLHQGSSGTVVLNWEDPTVARFGYDAPGEVVWFATRPGSGARSTGQRTALFQAQELHWYAYNASRYQHIDELICQRDDVQLAGQHNLSNVAAAAALARCYGIGSEAIGRAISKFRGVPHRMELVRELDGVRYINDTAATAPAAAIAALEAIEGRIILIAGGADKNLPFEPLARTIVERVAAVVLLTGSATAKLQAAIAQARRERGSRLQVEEPLNDFEQAVRRANELASDGGTVLLAPGCASFGMFRNEFQRGDEFRRLVQAL